MLCGNCKDNSPCRKKFNLPQTALLLLIILFSGFVIRNYSLNNNELILEGDEAIVGLMAKHITQGKSNPVFVYGQDYMGSLEAYTAAVVFLVNGYSVKSLKYAPFVFSMLLIIAIFFLIKSYCGFYVSICAALFAAVPPYLIVKWSLAPTGGHIENYFFSIVILYLIFKYIQTEKKFFLHLFALTSGFAFWVNPFSIFVFAGFAFYYFLLTPKTASQKISGYLFILLLFTIGSCPLTLYNINHNFITFKKLAGFFLGISAGDYNSSSNIIITVIEKFTSMLILIIPGFFKLTGYLFESLGNYYFDSLIYMLAIVWYCKQAYKKKDKFGYMMIIYIIIITLAMSISKRANRDRYLIIFFPAVIVSCSYILQNIINHGNYKKKIIFAVIVFLLFISNFAAIAANDKKNEIKNFYVKINKTINFLQEKNIQYIFADMYIAYPLSFLSEEKIIASPAAGFYNEDRIPEYTEKVLGNNGNVFIFYDRFNSSRVLCSGLKNLGISFSFLKIDDFDIIYGLTKPLDISKIPLSLRFKSKLRLSKNK